MRIQRLSGVIVLDRSCALDGDGWKIYPDGEGVSDAQEEPLEPDMVLLNLRTLLVAVEYGGNILVSGVVPVLLLWSVMYTFLPETAGFCGIQMPTGRNSPVEYVMTGSIHVTPIFTRLENYKGRNNCIRG